MNNGSVYLYSLNAFNWFHYEEIKVPPWLPRLKVKCKLKWEDKALFPSPIILAPGVSICFGKGTDAGVNNVVFPHGQAA